jgi:hypothetical protein
MSILARLLRLSIAVATMSAAITAPTIASAQADGDADASACGAGVTCQFGVRYGNGAAQTLDVYYPPAWPVSHRSS